MLIKDMTLEQYQKVHNLGFSYLYFDDLMNMCLKMNNPSDYWEEMKNMFKKDIINTDIQVQHVFIVNKEIMSENKEFLDNAKG